MRPGDIMKPSDLGLPYDKWYPLQFEHACEIAQAREPITLCERPTGGGKSLLAMAIAKMLKKPRAAILCSTKQLQAQYNSDFGEDAVVMFGRNNFICALDPDFTCDEAPCHLEGFGCSQEQKYSVCDYYRQKKKAAVAPIAILNASYFLHESNHVGQFSNLDFLVVDEGDLLERELLRFASIELSRKSFNWCDVDLPDLSSVYQARSWAKKHLPRVIQRAMEAEKEAREDMTHLKQAVRLKGHLKRLKQLEMVDPDRWVLQRTLYGYSIQPLWADSFGRDYVLRHAKKVLIMSATMPPPDVYSRQLGITEPVQYIETPSFFPKENRPVNFWPVVRLKGNQLDDYTLNQLANAIDLILERLPKYKGIVHTVSYKLRDAILLRTRYPQRFISHNLADGENLERSQALQRFLNSKESSVLISPSMGRGVDLPNDACRFVISAKMPYLSLGDQQVKSRMEQDPDWYAAATADALVQGFGRGIRHSADYCAGFLLDSQEWFFRRNKRFFADWFRESVVKINDLSEMVLPPAMTEQ